MKKPDPAAVMRFVDEVDGILDRHGPTHAAHALITLLTAEVGRPTATAGLTYMKARVALEDFLNTL